MYLHPHLALVSLITLLFGLGSVAAAQPLRLAPGEQDQLTARIFANECGGKTAALVSWNEGEGFCSLGIGHFIWFPAHCTAPFHESFPDLVRFCAARGQELPVWFSGLCPWPDRETFIASARSPRMDQLRRFLEDSRDLQAVFLIRRLEQTLPLITAASRAPRLTGDVIDRLAATPRGRYALVDYLNFKGSGLDPAERYAGYGWGLLQVIEEMDPDTEAPCDAFARAAATVLRRRVDNAPPARHEQRWLPGWLHRVAGYAPPPPA